MGGKLAKCVGHTCWVNSFYLKPPQQSSMHNIDLFIIICQESFCQSFCHFAHKKTQLIQCSGHVSPLQLVNIEVNPYMLRLLKPFVGKQGQSDVDFIKL